MRYHISAPNLDLSDRMQAVIMERVGRFERHVQNFPDDAVDADITVDRLHRTQDFEVSVRLGLTSVVLVAREHAPTLEQALGAAVDDVLDQLQRYKSRLRGEHLLNHSRPSGAPEEAAENAVPLLESRERLDQALVARDADLARIIEEQMHGIGRVLRRELQRRGVPEGPEQEALFERLLAYAIAEAQADIERKPGRMSLSGWVGLKVRKVVEEHFRTPEAGGWQGVA